MLETVGDQGFVVPRIATRSAPKPPPVAVPHVVEEASAVVPVPEILGALVEMRIVEVVEVVVEVVDVEAVEVEVVEADVEAVVVGVDFPQI
jgi:hypothetical protein